MNRYNGIDRRNSEHGSLALYFDVAVSYFRTIGPDKAMAYLHANGVPPAVAARVEGDVRQRRVTRWEMQIDEGALRAALGVRPLLAVPLSSARDTSTQAT